MAKYATLGGKSPKRTGPLRPCDEKETLIKVVDGETTALGSWGSQLAVEFGPPCL